MWFNFHSSRSKTVHMLLLLGCYKSGRLVIHVIEGYNNVSVVEGVGLCSRHSHFHWLIPSVSTSTAILHNIPSCIYVAILWIKYMKTERIGVYCVKNSKLLLKWACKKFRPKLGFPTNSWNGCSCRIRKYHIFSRLQLIKQSTLKTQSNIMKTKDMGGKNHVYWL